MLNVRAWLLAVGLAWGGTVMAGENALNTTEQKVGYCIGRDIGDHLKRQGVEVDVNTLTQGIKDVMGGVAGPLDEAQREKIMQEFQQSMQEKQMAKQKVAGDTNQKAGEAFLAENAKKEGVKTLPSGLQYKVLKSGQGESPTLESKVTAHYKGTLLDGTEFDSSYARGEPATFPLKHVIRGWQEALPLMKVGDKWQLFIPASLGYGDRGAGEKIGPNSTLIFEVELMGVAAGDEAKPADKK